MIGSNALRGSIDATSAPPAEPTNAAAMSGRNVRGSGRMRRKYVAALMDVPQKDASLLVAAICTTDELGRLGSLPAEQRLEHLVRLWTLKEAVGKCLGVGLAAEFASFAVDLESSGGESVDPVLISKAGRRLDRTWSLQSLPAPGGRWAAVARHEAPDIDELHDER